MILNLGCGTKTSRASDVLNIDWSMYMRLRSNRALARLAPLFLDEERLVKFRGLGDNVLAHDLAKGIPFPDASVDTVYHSHMLEHLDRDVAPGFLREAYRVLKPGGIHRIVVPDLELLCYRYLSHVESAKFEPRLRAEHDSYVEAIIEQSVRRSAYSAAFKSPVRRAVEKIVLGDARRRGETHQWMYDFLSLSHVLEGVGFTNVKRLSYDTSGIEGWNDIGLDASPDGGQYKPDSLFVEAEKP